jgi:hypothetical protein
VVQVVRDGGEPVDDPGEAAPSLFGLQLGRQPALVDDDRRAGAGRREADLGGDAGGRFDEVQSLGCVDDLVAETQPVAAAVGAPGLQLERPTDPEVDGDRVRRDGGVLAAPERGQVLGVW